MKVEWLAGADGHFVSIDGTIVEVEGWRPPPPPRMNVSQRWLHKRSGKLYIFVTIATRECDGEPLVIYRSWVDASQIWARPAAEFYDGRFERIQP